MFPNDIYLVTELFIKVVSAVQEVEDENGDYEEEKQREKRRG